MPLRGSQSPPCPTFGRLVLCLVALPGGVEYPPWESRYRYSLGLGAGALLRFGVLGGLLLRFCGLGGASSPVRRPQGASSPVWQPRGASPLVRRPRGASSPPVRRHRGNLLLRFGGLGGHLLLLRFGCRRGHLFRAGSEILCSSLGGSFFTSPSASSNSSFSPSCFVVVIRA